MRLVELKTNTIIIFRGQIWKQYSNILALNSFDIDEVYLNVLIERTILYYMDIPAKLGYNNFSGAI